MLKATPGHFIQRKNTEDRPQPAITVEDALRAGVRVEHQINFAARDHGIDLATALERGIAHFKVPVTSGTAQLHLHLIEIGDRRGGMAAHYHTADQLVHYFALAPGDPGESTWVVDCSWRGGPRQRGPTLVDEQGQHSPVTSGKQRATRQVPIPEEDLG